MENVHKASEELDALIDETKAQLEHTRAVEQVVKMLETNAMQTYNSTHKKQKVLSDFVGTIPFNPGSPNHVSLLLFTVLRLPTIKVSKKTGKASTDKETIDELQQIVDDAVSLEILDHLTTLSGASIIRANFLTTFVERATSHDDGSVRLHGNLNIVGTKSGRWSSNSPNLQNLPSGSKFGKMIKKCFKAPEGKVWVSFDFAALEERVAANVTKDRMKIKIFNEGYDSHSLSALAFYGDDLPDVNLDDVNQVNAIKTDYKKIRDDAKRPAFA
jgi:DNA polymerase-1